MRAAKLASPTAPNDPMEQAIVAIAERGIVADGSGPCLREYPLSPTLLAVTRAYEQAVGMSFFAKARRKHWPRCALSADEHAALSETKSSAGQAGLRVLAVGGADVGAQLPDVPSRSGSVFAAGTFGVLDPHTSRSAASGGRLPARWGAGADDHGDYPATALAIAGQAGLDVTHGVLSGPEMAENCPMRRCASEWQSVSVFARMVPEQSCGWSKHSKTWARCGDDWRWVNDAPALKARTSGFRWASGAPTSREASALVLADDNFASIVAAMRLGRRIRQLAQGGGVYVRDPCADRRTIALSPLLGWPADSFAVAHRGARNDHRSSWGLIFEGSAEEAHIMDRPPRPVNQPMVTGRCCFGRSCRGFALLGCAFAYYPGGAAGYPAERFVAMVFSTLVFANLGLIVVSRSWTESALRTLWKAGRCCGR